MSQLYINLIGALPIITIEYMADSVSTGFSTLEVFGVWFY